MPFPNQTDRQSIIETAAALIEAEGANQLSLGKLAQAVGVKAPSLYRHVKNKDEVLNLVTMLTFSRLFKRYDAAIDTASGSPIDQCLELALTHRAFAIETPNLYMLAFSRKRPDLEPDDDMLLAEAIKLQQIVTLFAGEENSLIALRGLLALIHGFVSLEINEQYRRGGDLEETFSSAVRSYLVGWC
ncbi:MAG: TetR/AcrR family transcriptional regulator [Chloroflexota bacterium]